MDIAYTLSKSLDYGSDAKRNTEFATSGSGGSFSDILNTWKPYLNKAVSDFDTHDLLTVDAVYQLPFGRNRAVLGGTNRLVDALVGGWRLSGINRTTSGLPFSLFEPGWTTDWQIESYGVVMGKVKMRRHFDQNGNPQFFDNPGGQGYPPGAINDGISTGSPVRLPYPGEAGQRNNFRGDGYFDIDSGLAESWSLGEYGGLRFDWEVYNVTNTVRFDPAAIGSGLTGGNLRVASPGTNDPGILVAFTPHAVALRYNF